MVPNSVLVNETVIHQKTLEFLDYVLDHQDSTGWIGPEVNTNKPRFLWGRSVSKKEIFSFLNFSRYPFFFGAIQLTEVHPELTDRVVTALHKFVPLANKMLHNNGEGVDAWAQTRWEDFVLTLQW